MRHGTQDMGSIIIIWRLEFLAKGGGKWLLIKITINPEIRRRPRVWNLGFSGLASADGRSARNERFSYVRL